MQVKADRLASTNGAVEHAPNLRCESLYSNEIRSFYQLHADQLAAQLPTSFVRVVYYNPLLKTHEAVSSQPLTAPTLSPESLAYLKSEDWLSDFPLVLALTEFPLVEMAETGYVCPLGYRNQTPEYVLAVTSEPLPLAYQTHLINNATLLVKYSNLYSSYCDQQAEIQLLEQVVHRVGHQLRNPLGLISLYAENLRLGLPSGQWHDQATVIHDAVQTVLTNLTDLINCGKGSQLRITLHDLRDVVTDSLAGLQPFIQQKHLNVVCSDTSVMLMIDRLQLKQVFDNLLNNAIHFSPPFSSIHLDWRVFQGEVLIQLTDHGPGLSPDDLQKIFNPFYSRRPGGTGLGLAIAKKIVLDHQGSLWAQNLSEGGARFSLTLPRTRAGVGS